MSEKLKQWFPLYKHILALVVIALFTALVLWSRENRVGYFFEWLSRQESSHIWACIVAVILTYLGKWAVASGLTAGWILGVPIGQMMGEAVYAYHQSIYTAEQMVYVGHKHAYIWWLSIAIGTLLGIVVQLIVWLCRKNRKRLLPADSRDLPQHQEC